MSTTTAMSQRLQKAVGKIATFLLMKVASRYMPGYVRTDPYPGPRSVPLSQGSFTTCTSSLNFGTSEWRDGLLKPLPEMAPLSTQGLGQDGPRATESTPTY